MGAVDRRLVLQGGVAAATLLSATSVADSVAAQTAGAAGAAAPAYPRNPAPLRQAAFADIGTADHHWRVL